MFRKEHPVLPLRVLSLARGIAFLGAAALAFSCASDPTDSGQAGGGSGGGAGAAGAGGTGAAGSGGSSGSAGSAGSSGTCNGSDHSLSSGAGQLFGSHTFQYPGDVARPSGGPSALDSATASFYDAWKASYLKTDSCGTYVASSGGTGAQDSLTISEAHGFGMVITALMEGHDSDAHSTFDNLFTFFSQHQSASGPGLMTWAITPQCGPDPGGNDSATDGDIDIAFSLLLADKQWGSSGSINYFAEAEKVMCAIESREINPTTGLTLLGDWATPDDTDRFGTRPSDFMTDHFHAFTAATGYGGWSRTIDAMYSVISTMQSSFSPSTGLIPDFVVNTDTSPVPASANYLETQNDGAYAYNSCRVPWRIGTDYLTTGDARAKAAVQKINGWIKSASGGQADSIASIYKLDGTAVHADWSGDPAFVAPFGVAAMVSGDQSWLDDIWTTLAAGQVAGDNYYGDTIQVLCMIAMSGNWWAP